MNFIGKLCLLALVCALLAPLFIRTPDGRPLMTLDDWIPDIGGIETGFAGFLSRLNGIAREAVGRVEGGSAAGGDGGATPVFRWQDSEGVWHFAASPPPGVEAERILLDPDVNLVPAFRPSADSGSPGDATEPSLPSSVIGGAVVGPAELVRRAEAIRTQSQERVERLRQLEAP